jgi:hypothetical protein
VNEPEVFDALVAAWEREIAPHVRRDCCILAARATSLVLDYYGIPNKVVPCEVFIANDAALTELDKGNADFTTWPEGAWSMGAGGLSPGEGYAGHVVVNAAQRVIDLSAGQFHRAGRINIDGPRVWNSGAMQGNSLVILEHGVWMLFTPTRDRTYRNTPDWRRGRVAASRIIRTINNNGRINEQ